MKELNNKNDENEKRVILKLRSLVIILVVFTIVIWTIAFLTGNMEREKLIEYNNA